MKTYFSLKSIPELSDLSGKERRRLWRRNAWKSFRHWQTWLGVLLMVFVSYVGIEIANSMQRQFSITSRYFVVLASYSTGYWLFLQLMVPSLRTYLREDIYTSCTTELIISKRKLIFWKILGIIFILALCLPGYLRLSYTIGPIKDSAVFVRPSASDIIKEVAMRYEHCQTYQDKGQIKCCYLTIPLFFRTSKEFKTAFNRQGQFRFEFTESGNANKSYVIWRYNGDVKTWWWIDNKHEKVKDLNCAIRSAKGISETASFNIPALLLPNEIEGAKIINKPGMYRIADSTLKGVYCFRLQTVGTNPSKKTDDAILDETKYKTTYWIDKRTFDILQIEKETCFPWFKTWDIIAYSPKFDYPIPAEFFAFGH